MSDYPGEARDEKASLYRDAFGEVARFIDVAAEFDGEMIGEKLQRNDGENRHQAIGHVGEFRMMSLASPLKLFRAVAAGDRDDRAFARFDLLDVVQVF